MTEQKPLTGKELREAAAKKIPVRYVYEPHNPEDAKIDDICVMEPASGQELWFYIGDSDINLNDYGDDEPVKEEVPEGWMAVYPGDRGTAKDQLKERLAKFLHEDWADWVKYLFNVSPRMRMSYEGVPQYVNLILQHHGDRWKRQMNTDYEDLPEDEKKPDLELAEKLMKLLEE